MAQSAFEDVTEGLRIQPSGVTGTVNFSVPPVAGSKKDLLIDNPHGDINFLLPATSGEFSIFKRNGSQMDSILDVTPGSTDAVTIHANTSVTGTLTVAGAAQFNASYGFGTTYAGAVALGTGSANQTRAAVIGGLYNNSSADSAAVVGGRSNTALGTAVSSAIIGGEQNYTKSPFSAIIASNGSAIDKVGPLYGGIFGGQQNSVGVDAGSFNAIIGGYFNQIVSGGSTSVLAGGIMNKIVEGSENLAILGGNANQIGNARNSVIVGGEANKVLSISGAGYWGHSIIAGGYSNQVTAGAMHSVFGGYGNEIVSGWMNTVVGASEAKVSGGYNTVMGLSNISSGNSQLVIGKFNSDDSSKLFIIGNGSSTSTRSNAVTVDAEGKLTSNKIETKSVKVTEPPDTSDISMGPFTQGTP